MRTNPLSADVLKDEMASNAAVSQATKGDLYMSGTWTDPRDGYSYRIVQLRDGNWWFPAHETPDNEVLATNPGYDWRKYGRLYTWRAAKKAIPPGWHLPSDREWKKMLRLYGGYGEGVGKDPKYSTGKNENEILIRDELDIEFGGCLDAWNHPDSGSSPAQPPFSYTYFGRFMGGRFWSSRRQFPFNSGAFYYIFTPSGKVWREGEHYMMAFSVRCIKN
jgi:uncharacterized protein (TIGR02145 family)